MAKLLAIYRTPRDPAAFDAYYAKTHAPLARKLPGLHSYEISKGAVATPAGLSGLHLIALLEFDSIADIQAALASPEGKVVAADLANFADGGVDLYLFQSGEA